MKLQFLSLLALFASGSAFAPVAMVNTAGRRGLATTFVMASSASEEAVKDAMAAAEKYGKASPEARAAWDIVEEIDAANR